MHAPQVRERGADLRRDLRQLRLHRRRRRGDARLPARADRRRASRASARSTRAEGEAADLGPPYLLTVATLEPRKNLGTLVEAFALLGDTGLALAVVGGGGLGRAAASSTGPASSGSAACRRRGARAPLPRRRGRRLPVAVRGLRDADHRGDGVAGRRSSRRRTRRSTRRAATPRCGADPESPEAMAAAIREALARGTSCARSASRTRRRSRGRQGELFLEGYRRFA